MVTLSLPDFLIVLAIFGFAAFGFALGLIHVIGGLVGIVAGAWLANLIYLRAGAQLAPYALGNERAAAAVAFLVIFLVVNRATAIGFTLLNRIFNLLSFIPFLKSLNRLAGGLFGLLEGALLVGVVIQFSQSFWLPLWAQGWLEQSQFAGTLVALAQVFQAFLPALGVSPRLPSPYERAQMV